jgi:hypothetical protein
MVVFIMKDNNITFKCWGCDEQITIEYTQTLKRLLEANTEVKYWPCGAIVKCPNCTRENYFGPQGANKGALKPAEKYIHKEYCFKCASPINYGNNLQSSCGWLLCHTCHRCCPQSFMPHHKEILKFCIFLEPIVKSENPD